MSECYPTTSAEMPPIIIIINRRQRHKHCAGDATLAPSPPVSSMSTAPNRPPPPRKKTKTKMKTKTKKNKEKEKETETETEKKTEKKNKRLEFSPALQFAPDAYHFSELSAEDAVLARTFRREHVHGASLADKARDSRRFNNAAQALELAFAALDQPIRHGRNEPACFTCTDPSGHVVAASREPERGYADNAARWCCPLCLEPIFQPDDCDDDVEEDGGDGGVGGRDVFFDSDTDGDDGDGNGWW